MKKHRSMEKLRNQKLQKFRGQLKAAVQKANQLESDEPKLVMPEMAKLLKR